MLKLTESNFVDTVSDDKPVVVDFSAVWCGPCRISMPTYTKWAESYSDKAVWGKVDIDEAPSLAEKYGIASVPTVIVFKEGKVSKKFVGFPTEKEVLKALE